MSPDDIDQLAKPKLRRIITELRLDKIAAVDRPCQEGAVATIMKRAPDKSMTIFKARGEHSVDADDQAEMPQALAKLAAKGCDLTKIKAAHREEIIRKYNAGRRVTVMFATSGETFILKKGEDTWHLNIPKQSEVEKVKSEPYEDLKSGNHDDEEGEEEMHDFMSKVDEVAARDGISKTAAMEKVRKSRPDLYQQLQNRSPVAKAAPERVTKSAAQVKFEDRVAEVAKSRGLPMTRAQDHVRRTEPELFRLAYG